MPRLVERVIVRLFTCGTVQWKRAVETSRGQHTHKQAELYSFRKIVCLPNRFWQHQRIAHRMSLTSGYFQSIICQHPGDLCKWANASVLRLDFGNFRQKYWPYTMLTCKRCLEYLYYSNTKQIWHNVLNNYLVCWKIISQICHNQTENFLYNNWLLMFGIIRPTSGDRLSYM